MGVALGGAARIPLTKVSVPLLLPFFSCQDTASGELETAEQYQVKTIVLQPQSGPLPGL